VIFRTSTGTHIKMIKRKMYGRAGFSLLRKRILLTARPGGHHSP
jgi:hypothetical protein